MPNIMQFEPAPQGAFAPASNPRRMLSAGTLTGDNVRNREGEDLGKIEEIMIDVESGAVAYAVLSFGGFLGIGDKLFAIPWEALEVDELNREFILNVDKQTLKNAPGFDKDNWPEMADISWGADIHAHYQLTPYWESPRFRTSTTREEGIKERLNNPDLPEELRRRPIDVTKFPGREKDADLKTADPSRTYDEFGEIRTTRK